MSEAGSDTCSQFRTSVCVEVSESSGQRRVALAAVAFNGAGQIKIEVIVGAKNPGTKIENQARCWS